MGGLFHHHGVITHPREVRASCGRASEDDAHGRDLRFGALGEATKRGSAGGEYLGLVGEVGPGGLRQGDGGEPVLRGDRAESKRFLKTDLVDRSSLHGRFVRGDEAFHARDDSDPADHASPRRDASHTVSSQRAELEKMRVRVEEELDALPGEELAARAMIASELASTLCW